MSLKAAFDILNKALGLAPLPPPSFTGNEAVAPTPLRIGAASALSLGVFGAVAGEIWRLRGGSRQSVAIALADAVAATRCTGLMRRNGDWVPSPFKDHPLTGFYQSADGGWLYLHGGFEGASRLLDLINADNRADAILEGVAKWHGPALEEAIAYMNLCGSLSRSESEWRVSPPGSSLDGLAPVVLKKIGEAPPLRLEQHDRPLAGLRVLDSGCALAGPLGASLLGALGAEVLAARPPSPREPIVYGLAAGANKRLSLLDFAKPADAETMRRALRGTDILIDSHRPGALRKYGFSREALMHNAPGLIHVEISAYGPVGPWAMRRGFEADVQAATGIAAEQGSHLSALRKKRAPLPALVDADLCTVLAGQLAAAGAAAAVLRRIREGGSWSVSVSLAGAAMWLQSLGRLEAVPGEWLLDLPAPSFATCENGPDVWTVLKPALSLDKTPLSWQPPSLDATDKEARFASARNDAYAA